MSAPEQSAGGVYLVGAGPGDPGLLTARALELIAQADVVLYDRLIPVQALEGARADAELLYVGKQGSGEAVPQEQTEELLLSRAREGKLVVRLKGGDPFVFGRGGEEALALREAGVSFEVVPGVTAGVAACAYAGIPVTHRGVASAVALVTGHEDPEKGQTALDWQALAAFPGTLVFYMGIRQLPQIADSLIAAGRAGTESAAVVERGTLPTQRTVTATLATIAKRANEEDMRPPSITVVGEVTRLAEHLRWRSPGPLIGLTVAVTRARAQASGLARRLAELGASVIQAPVIRTQALPGEALDPAPYDLICLTSPNAVEYFFERLKDGARDARALAHARVAVIGPGSASALREHGITADLVAEQFVAESLLEALSAVPVSRALVARAREAREVLAEGLRARGAQVDVLALYETVPEPLSGHALDMARAADYITFTSSSTVRYFLEAAGDTEGLGKGTRIASIGPVTTAALREHGLEPDVEAQPHDVEGLIAALLADASRAAR